MDQETTDIVLERPGKELAAHVTRQLYWDERIDGIIEDPGPGPMTYSVYKLRDLSNLLRSLPNFTVNLDVLRKWAGESLGDPELSDAIGKILDDRADGTEGTGDDARHRIGAILEHRLTQCDEELVEDAPGDDPKTDGGVQDLETEAS